MEQHSSASLLHVRVGCDVRYEVEHPTPMLFLVEVPDGDEQHVLQATQITEPPVPIERIRDGYGSIVWRVVAPPGPFHLRYDAVVAVPSPPDPVFLDLPKTPIEQLPGEVISYLWPTRYCP
ncbi:MAG: transglutaminase family protein, partial [Chloroflexi bacterium]|nr:transglutaminase family protein [Chloroflexota bacterium]